MQTRNERMIIMITITLVPRDQAQERMDGCMGDTGKSTYHQDQRGFLIRKQNNTWEQSYPQTLIFSVITQEHAQNHASKGKARTTPQGRS